MNSKRIWYLLGGVLAVAIIALGWFLGASPSMSQAALNDQARADVDTQNDAQQAALVTTKAQFARIGDLRAQLATMQLSIPGAADVDDLFDQITAMAASAGTSVTSISAGEAEPYGTSGAPGSGSAAPAPAPSATPAPSGTPAPAPTAGAGGATGATAGAAGAAPSDLFMIPVTITLTGGRDAAVAMVDALQSPGHRLMLVNKLTITSSPDSASIGGYVFLVHDASAPADAAAGSQPAPGATRSAAPSASSAPATPSPTPTSTK